MKIALYARVSISDKEQNPLTQLLPMREFVLAQGWETYREYVDNAPATDLAHRTQWRLLLEEASKHRFDLLLVWRMDRAFRSVLDASTTLERLKTWGVGLRSNVEPWLDTTSPFGEALYYITVAYAQMESIINSLILVPDWKDRILERLSTASERQNILKQRKQAEAKLKRLVKTYIDGSMD